MIPALGDQRKWVDGKLWAIKIKRLRIEMALRDRRERLSGGIPIMKRGKGGKAKKKVGSCV